MHTSEIQSPFLPTGAAGLHHMAVVAMVAVVVGMVMIAVVGGVVMIAVVVMIRCL